jgi:hypothetical protein
MNHIRTLTAQSPAMRLTVVGVGFVLLTAVVMYVLEGREMPMLLAALSGLFCFWLFRNPHWGVLAIFVFWFARFSPTLLGSRYLQLTHIIAALLLVPLGLRLMRDRDVWVWRVPQVRYLLFIGSIFLISTVWAEYYKYPVTFLPDLDRTFQFTQDFITHFVFLVYFLYFVNTRQKLTAGVWVVVGLIVASVASAYVTLFSVAAWHRANAQFGVGTNPTSFPYVTLFGASLLWTYYSSSQSQRWKGWLLPLIVALPVMSLASGSRTGLLQLGLFVFLVVRDRSSSWSRSQRIRGFLLLACVVVLISLLVPAIAVLRSTSFETSSSAPGGQSLKDRVSTIYHGIAMVSSDPILGVGLGNFLWLHAASYGLPRLPHNTYLWAIVEGGIGVFVIYLLLLLTTYRMLRQLEAHGPRDLLWVSKGLRFNMVLLVLYSMSDDTFLYDLTFFLLAATVALYRLWASERLAAVPERVRPTVLQPSVEPAR